MNLTKAILLSLIAGLIVGIVSSYIPAIYFTPVNDYVLIPIGKIFIGLIKMLVVPVVFCSMTIGVFQLGHPKKLGSIGGKAIFFFLCTTIIAIIIAICLALIIKPGNVSGIAATTAVSANLQHPPGMVEMLINIIPENPLNAMVTGNMLQVIFFSILFGLGIALLGEKVSALKRLILEINEVLMKIMHLVMYVAPFGAFALITSAIGSNGVHTLQQMALYVMVVVFALLTHFFVTYNVFLRLFGNTNIINFTKKFYPAMIVGFSTSSSCATLPVAMKTAQERLHISPPISSFVQSLGATINMDGTAIMQGVATIFIAQVYHIDLSFVQIITVILTATLASIGTAGVPAVGLVMLMIILEQVGLPADGIGLIIGIDRILDMLRTSMNITGDAVCAFIIDRFENKNKISRGIPDRP